MKFPWPRSLRGQLVVIILAALALAQGLSLWLFVDERAQAVRAVLGAEVAERAANVAVLLDETPVALHGPVLRAASSPRVRFEESAAARVAPPRSPRERLVARRLAALLGSTGSPRFRVHIRDRRAGARAPSMGRIPAMTRGMSEGMSERMGQRMDQRMDQRMGDMMRRPPPTVDMQIGLPLRDGHWLHVDTSFRRPPYQVAWNQAATFLVTAGMILAVLWVALGRLTRPLRALASAARRIGGGDEVIEVPPSGPRELRTLTRAFNEMQHRLKRFVEERAQLLAGLGHDLRSPLTAMRLRVEMIEDDESRERLGAVVEEMQEMVESTLAFARGMATSEPAQRTDLSAFLADLVAGYGQKDARVTFRPPAGPVISRVHPVALRRALRNLVDNALRYGGSAAIGLRAGDGRAELRIEDTGPGIPEAELERVFEPFVRLETSRSRETGGSGLGLAIARAILRAHGGDVSLANRPDGGLSARVSLPLAEETG